MEAPAPNTPENVPTAAPSPVCSAEAPASPSSSWLSSSDEEADSTTSKIKVIKIYMNKKVYSIYDRVHKKFIYHAKHRKSAGFKINYSKDGFCESIYDRNGRVVYAKPNSGC
ncbi:hypothetical protein F4859DRAFT_512214 [Xylaria cf. heliscus]|nr:hypothetical protein F4859DRAFT_512214 [Xylaria cf. heliscus]